LCALVTASKHFKCNCPVLLRKETSTQIASIAIKTLLEGQINALCLPLSILSDIHYNNMTVLQVLQESEGRKLSSGGVQLITRQLANHIPVLYIRL